MLSVHKSALMLSEYNFVKGSDEVLSFFSNFGRVKLNFWRLIVLKVKEPKEFRNYDHLTVNYDICSLF